MNRGEGKVRAKLQKLLTLARQGVGGEKENAKSLLEKMLSRHGLKIEDLDDDEAPKDIHWFKPKTKEEKGLLTNCVAMIVGSKRCRESWRVKGGRATGYELTSAEYAQVQLIFDIHSRAFRKFLEKQKRAAMIAYISANDIFSGESQGDEPKESELSPEDVAAIASMMFGLRPTPVYKAISKQD